MKIVIVDDHKLIFDGIVNLLSNIIQGADFVHHSNANDALRYPLVESGEGFYLLDIGLGSSENGLELAETLISWGARCVMMSGDDRPATIMQAKSIGAAGFIPKNYYGQKLALAIQAIVDGRTFFPALPSLEGDAVVNGLSKKQVTVLKLLEQGHTNKAIGLAMNISEVTVKGHVRAILKALGVKNRASAIATAAGLEPGSNRNEKKS